MESTLWFFRFLSYLLDNSLKKLFGGCKYVYPLQYGGILEFMSLVFIDLLISVGILMVGSICLFFTHQISTLISGTHIYLILLSGMLIYLILLSVTYMYHLCRCRFATFLSFIFECCNVEVLFMFPRQIGA